MAVRECDGYGRGLLASFARRADVNRPDDALYGRTAEIAANLSGDGWIRSDALLPDQRFQPVGRYELRPTALVGDWMDSG
jgi:hypothetical protein